MRVVVQEERRRGPVRAAGLTGPRWWLKRVCVMAACLKGSCQKPSRWSTPPSLAVASSGGCVWVRTGTHAHLYTNVRLGVLTNWLCWSCDQGTGTACWCPTTRQTRSCSTSETVCPTASASSGWRSGSPPLEMSLPATTMWRWCTLTWTG